MFQKTFNLEVNYSTTMTFTDARYKIIILNPISCFLSANTI